MSLAAGLAAWERGEPFAAHEAFEEAWRRTAPGDERTLLHALAQLAAAGHKLASGVRVGGAPAILARARTKLESLPDAVAGIDVAKLAEDVARLEQALRGTDAAGGPANPLPLPRIPSAR